MTRFRFRPLAAGLLALLPLVARPAEIAVRAAPMAEVPRDGAHELRVLYLVDPRLPTLDAAQRQALHEQVRALMQSWFGYTLAVREVGVRDLAATFAASQPLFARHATMLKLDFDPTTREGRDRLRAVVARDLATRSPALIAQHLGPGPWDLKDAAVEAACSRFLARWAEIRSLPLANGDPLAHPPQPAVHGFHRWCAYLHEQADADLVITNTLIGGADMDMPLYVIGRGGITSGITNANRHNRYRAGSVIGLLPLLSDGPFWQRERGIVPATARVDLIATLALHELAHLFLRRAENYQHAACVHVAPPGLRYYDWHRAIRARGPCLLPHARVVHY